FVDGEIQIAFEQLALTDFTVAGPGGRIEQIERDLNRDRNFVQTSVARSGDPGLDLSAQPYVMPGAYRVAVDPGRLPQIEIILPRVQFTCLVLALESKPVGRHSR